MKQTLFSLLFSLLFTLSGHSQSCFPDGINFYYQSEVDNFRANAPGCTSIAGWLTIQGADITNLDSLIGITSIGGSLAVFDAPLLTNLNGLNNLLSVDGDLSIYQDQSLTNLTGLNNLSTIGGYLYIADNPELLSLDGLENLSSIGTTLYVVDDAALTNLNGLSNLTSIGDIVLLYQLESLQNLDGLNKVVTTGSIDIEYCPVLSSIAGFQNLKTINGSLKIWLNPALTSLNSFNMLETLSDSIDIRGNNLLTEVGGLNNIQLLTSAWIVGNPVLTSLSGLQHLTTITNNLSILDNPLLADMSGLGQLETLGGNFWLSLNHVENMNGFKSLKTIGKNLLLNEPFALSSLTGLEKLTSIQGNFELNTNRYLDNLTGLDNLESVGGDLRFLGHDSITSLIGIGKLTTVGGTLEVSSGNLKLHNLKGFDHLKTVHKDVNITTNYVLTSLEGLENLDSIGGRFTVSYNPVLSQCAVAAMCHELAVAPDSVFITGNAWGCYPAQVKAECDLQPDQCLLNGINFESQASIDSFAIHYPGCREIIGGVVISGLGVTNLDSLSVLTKIGSGLSIYGTMLTGLKGLENLSSVLGIGVVNNDALQNLDGLESLTNLESFQISNNTSLNNLNALGNIKITVTCTIEENNALTSLAGLEKMDSLYSLSISSNPLLADLSGLDNLKSVRNFYLASNDGLIDLSGMNQLGSILSLNIGFNNSLVSLAALGNAQISSNCDISYNASLTSLVGLEKTDSLDYLYIQENPLLTNLTGLNNLRALGTYYGANVLDNAGLKTLNGLENLKKAGNITIGRNPSLENLQGLNNLQTVSDTFSIWSNATLNSLSALTSLHSTGGLVIDNNPTLPNLHGLDSLRTIVQDFGPSPAGLFIGNNAALTNIQALENLIAVDKIEIRQNTALPACAVFPVCNRLATNPDWVFIENNAPGCNSQSEVEIQCNGTIVTVAVRYDPSGNCQSSGVAVPNEMVNFTTPTQSILRQTSANGTTQFIYLGNDPTGLSFQLPQIQTEKWVICGEWRQYFTSSTGHDSISVQIVLNPLVQCPELNVRLGMPSFFRGCLTTSDIEVSTQNTGTIPAQGVKVAVVLTPVLELLASAPPLEAQSGDTLYFNLGSLQPFGKSNIVLSVRTRCDTFLLDQTLCIKTFANLDNACPNTLPDLSEITLTATCIGDTTIRFTMKNIGNAPTQGWYEYRIIRNDAIQYNNGFSLAAQQSLSFDFPADAATWRMEATKFDDGTETAVALENCGGLTPGWINAFWLDHGPPEYDFDCRQVIGSFDPNLKSAVPTGYAPLKANRPILYTIDFQNTGTDTAYRVVLRDVLPANLDVNTFRPVLASHPNTWEIRSNTLEVLFSPIALPDSNVNEPASHGFFSFNIDQKPNLPDGTYLENTADIIFDFNPPIYTNYVYHYIGKLTVKVDEPQAHVALWQVLGNPTRDVATFQAMEQIAGEKQFDLYDAAGRQVRSAQFSGQVFEFHRDMLEAGVYFFRIVAAKGKVFSGKIVVTD
jgi:uncharacterized repeat protein (TIGR01451 family)